MMQEMALAIGDVVQINPDTKTLFGGHFAVVYNTYYWGCVAHIYRSDNNELIFIRLDWDEMEYVGKATWVR